MRKIWLFTVIVALVTISITSCSSCKKESKGSEEVVVNTDDCDGVLPEITASVENIIATDRQAMYSLTHNGDYRWFETTVFYDTPFDDDSNAGEAKILSITNTFQAVIENGNGMDVKIYLYKTPRKEDKPQIVDAFMLENNPLNDEEIKLTFDQAYKKLMEANIVKPKSQYCVLRKPVGPINCNAQYIFGNRRTQVYVDAVTGNVSAENPAFDKKGFGMPLGEWP